MNTNLINYNDYFNNYILKIEPENGHVKSCLFKSREYLNDRFRVIFDPHQISIYGLNNKNFSFRIDEENSLEWVLSLKIKGINHLMGRMFKIYSRMGFIEFSKEKALEALDKLKNEYVEYLKIQLSCPEDCVKYTRFMESCVDSIDKIYNLARDLPNLNKEEIINRFITDTEVNPYNANFVDFTSDAYLISAALFKFCELYKNFNGKRL